MNQVYQIKFKNFDGSKTIFNRKHVIFHWDFLLVSIEVWKSAIFVYDFLGEKTRENEMTRYFGLD